MMRISSYCFSFITAFFVCLLYLIHLYTVNMKDDFNHLC